MSCRGPFNKNSNVAYTSHMSHVNIATLYHNISSFAHLLNYLFTKSSTNLLDAVRLWIRSPRRVYFSTRSTIYRERLEKTKRFAFDKTITSRPTGKHTKLSHQGWTGNQHDRPLPQYWIPAVIDLRTNRSSWNNASPTRLSVKNTTCLSWTLFRTNFFRIIGVNLTWTKSGERNDV